TAQSPGAVRASGRLPTGCCAPTPRTRCRRGSPRWRPTSKRSSPRCIRARSAISVGQASGLALAVAARAGVPVVQYSPNEVKLAVTGDGAADKVAVQTMVTRLLNLAEVPKPADAADALALACCHHGKARMLERIPS